MKKLMTKLFLSSLMLCTTFASADYCFPAYVGSSSEAMPLLNNSHLAVEPLFAKTKLTQGSLKEKGLLYGAKANFDILVPMNLYVGAEGGYFQSDLKGKSRDQLAQLDSKSKYSDSYAEGKIGMTLGDELSTFSPYAVLGWEKETHEFKKPALYAMANNVNYYYLGAGLKTCYAYNNFTLGLDVKFKWMFNAKHKTSGSSAIENKGFASSQYFHCNVELPIGFVINQNTTVALAPYFALKRYDTHKFDWLGVEKLKIENYGLLLKLAIAY